MKSKQLADRLGNLDSRLIQEAEHIPNYAQRRRRRGLKRILAVAATLSLMLCSFTMGALAFSTERVVEVPAQQEVIELEDLGLTLILPDSWAGQYEVVPWEGQYAVICPEIREAALAQGRQEWADGGSEWPEELDRNPFSGGMLFYIVGVPEALAPEQVADSQWSFAGSRYLFATAERTYLLYYASDVQFTAETWDQYANLSQGISDIRIIVDGVLG